MKVVNKKLFVVSVILLVLSLIAWIYLLQPVMVVYEEDDEVLTYLSLLGTDYFIQFLASISFTGIAMMSFIGTIFVAFCTIRGIVGLLKACGVIKMKTLKGLFSFFGFLLGLIMLGVAFFCCGLNAIYLHDHIEEYSMNFLFELVMFLNVFIMCIVAKILQTTVKKAVKKAKEEEKFQKAVAEAVAEKETKAE